MPASPGSQAWTGVGGTQTQVSQSIWGQIAAMDVSGTVDCMMQDWCLLVLSVVCNMRWKSCHVVSRGPKCFQSHRESVSWPVRVLLCLLHVAASMTAWNRLC